MQINIFVTNSHGEKLLNVAVTTVVLGLEIGNHKQDFEVYFRIHKLKSDILMCFGLFGGIRIIYWISSISLFEI